MQQKLRSRTVHIALNLKDKNWPPLSIEIQWVDISTQMELHKNERAEIGCNTV